MNTTTEQNKRLVWEAFDTLFKKRGYAAAEKLWSPPGTIVADGDFVIVHGRFSGFLPVNWTAADILRVTDGMLVELWDVIQDEATREESKSKAPMFGTSFPIYPDRTSLA
jgi:hypothetical protein